MMTGLAAAIAAALPPPRVRALRCHATDVAAVDLALVAVAAVDSWASGTSGLPRPPRAAAILAACHRVSRRHSILVSGGHHKRAAGALTTIATRVNAHPAPEARGALLCALVLDLLNDRAEDGFGAVSDALSSLHLAAPGDVDRVASSLADELRATFGVVR